MVKVKHLVVEHLDVNIEAKKLRSTGLRLGGGLGIRGVKSEKKRTRIGAMT